MSRDLRAILNSEPISLEELVTRYGNNKTEMDSYKKAVDEDNKMIKAIMQEEDIKEFKAGGFVAKYSVAVSEGFDEEKLLAKVKELGGNLLTEQLLIKTREYIDMEVLENAIYTGKINAVDLADCRTRTETPKLIIKKVKEKK